MARRIRVQFSKLGSAAFVGHLDLVRLLPRIARRAGIRLRYSQGFHPLPELTFGPALPVGVAGLRELADLRVLGDDPVDGLAERLCGGAPDGVRFARAVELGAQDRSVSRALDVVRYVIGLPRAAVETMGASSETDVAERIAAARAQGDLRVRRVVEGVGKVLDVGAWLLDARVGEGADELTDAGLAGWWLPVTLELRLSGQGGIRASEVVEALLGRDLPVRIVRTAMMADRDGRRVDPMDVAAMRACGARVANEDRPDEQTAPGPPPA